MVFSYCKCIHHVAGNPDTAANFYSEHFVPRGWSLNYTPQERLEQELQMKKAVEHA